MKTEELNVAVYNKMNEEQAIYLEWLMSLSAKEILQHSYEYTVRQDILMAMEYIELQPEQCEALLKSPCPMRDVYDDFNKLETDYMDTIRNCISSRADKMIAKVKEREAMR